MIRLFNEEVEVTSTSLPHNTIYVESYEEVFFGVYELKLNGSTVLAEEVSKYDGNPVISVPVNDNGNNYEAPFVLKRGLAKVEFATVNKVYTEEVEVEPAPIVEDVKPIVVQRNVEKTPTTTKIQIAEGIAIPTSSSNNTVYTEDYNETFFGVYEFKLAGELIIAEAVSNYNGDPVVRLSIKDDGMVTEAPFILKKGEERVEFNPANDVFTEEKIVTADLDSITEAVRESAVENNNVNISINVDRDSLLSEFRETIDAEKERITERLLSVTSDSVEQLADIRDSLFVEFAENSTQYREQEEQKLKVFIERTLNNICLENNILFEQAATGDAGIVRRRDVNKALSRLGTVKKELADTQVKLNEDLVSVEERIKTHYDEKMEQVRESAASSIRKDEVLKVIVDSKNKILDELSKGGGFKTQMLKLAEEVSKGEYDPISSKRFQENLKRDLAARFTGEMKQIKRMVEILTSTGGGGGGTNAVQYKNGGTMEGTLNVTGQILSAGVDLNDLGLGSGGGGGSDVSSLSGNWEGTYTTVAANSAIWGAHADISDLSANWEGTYSTMQAESGDWESVYTTVQTNSTFWSGGLSGGGGATVLNELDDVTISSPASGSLLNYNGSSQVWENVVDIDINSVQAGSLGTTGVTTTSAVSFLDGTTGFVVSAGQVAWNPEEFTLDMGVNDNVTLQIGQEQLMHVKGDSNNAIRNGMAVYAGGVVGASSLIQISAYSSNVDFVDELYVIGLATEDLIANEQGFVTTFGRVRGIDGTEYSSGGVREDGTPAWNVGDIIYPSISLSARGSLTNIAPISPNREIPIAIVTTAASENNITLFVRANGAHGYHLEELHNVNYSGNPDDGSLLTYVASTSTWDASTDIGIDSISANGDILSGGVNLLDVFADGGGEGNIDGSGTAGNLTLWDGISTITDSVMTESGGTISINGNVDTVFSMALSSTVGVTTLSASAAGLYVSNGLNAYGNSTIHGNLSVLGDFTYIDTTISVTSALSVTNSGTGPALYVEQSGSEPIAKFIDSEGGSIVFNDTGAVGIGTDNPSEKLTVSGNISASGNITSVNIDTLTNNVSALYSYLIQNFDSNQITDATDINDFVTNYPKTGLQPGDVITLSATNTAYILGNNDGSALTDWFEVNLKPNFLFYKQGLTDYGVLDTLPLSSAKSTKYLIEVEDKSDGALFYGEVNVVSNGTVAVASEYGLNHTTIFPFVEFGAEVIAGTHIQLSAIALESKDMSNFVFKGNRSNLFGH